MFLLTNIIGFAVEAVHFFYQLFTGGYKMNKKVKIDEYKTNNGYTHQINE